MNKCPKCGRNLEWYMTSRGNRYWRCSCGYDTINIRRYATANTEYKSEVKE